MLTIACRDVGQPCDCVLSGETEEEILKKAAEHAVNDHGFKEAEIRPLKCNKILNRILREFKLR